jgi:hypothetical protein
MAKFISLDSSAAALDAGEFLVSAEAIVYVDQTANVTTKIYLDGAAAANDLITITHTSTGTDPSMREAVNYALTANPGGVKAKVSLPSGITISAIVLS